MVKSIKKARNVKVVVEIPTYPYQGQFKGASFEAKLSLFLDIIFRKSFSKLIDSYVTFTDDNTIFGAPNISISNGIDFDSIKLREKSHRVLDKSNPSNSFYLISVSEVHYWHGIDRVIEGLSKYYSNPNNKMSVFFMIIGRGFGSEYNDLMLLARKRGLDGYITFYGNRSGEELNKLFEMADFGVASLARHRSNITKIKTLKNREYAARGIPFIYSEIDDDFEGMPYIMKATPDDTPLDICSIIDFYNKCDYSPLQIRNSIIDTLSWREQMKKVIKVI
jgi:glycosyltransferase involved in cell wall biosynthesis